MDNYSPQVVPLVSGLDFTTNKLLGNPGTLQDCLNREIIDSVGYKRIDGIEPYDGRLSPAIDEFFILRNTTYGSGVTTDFTFGDLLVVLDSTHIFGKVLSSRVVGSSYEILYARIDKDHEPNPGAEIVVLGGSSSFDATDGVFSASLEEVDALAAVTAINAQSVLLRGDITNLHDVAIGLHWYRDRLYSVVTDRSISFDSGGTQEPLPNYYMKGVTTGTVVRLVAVSLAAGTWAGGTASGFIQYEQLSGPGLSTGEVLQYDHSTAFSSPLSADIATTTQVVVPSPEYASLWVSRSEKQAQEDSASVGWQRVDCGWESGYTNGLSDSGGLVVVSRGSDNNFVFETGDEYVVPEQRYNGANVVGAPFAPYSQQAFSSQTVVAGYPGWKTTANPAIFAASAAMKTATSTLGDSIKAYANIWYQGGGNFSTGSTPAGWLSAVDKAISGPAQPVGVPPPGTIGTETFEADFSTTNARAPIMLSDLSSVAASIPDGSIVVGIEVVVDYDTQHYFQATFKGDRNGVGGATIGPNTLAWVKDTLAWQACLVEITDTVDATVIGAVQSTPLLVDGVIGNYETDQVVGPGGAYSDTGSFVKTLTGQTATIGSPTSTFGAGSLTKTRLLDPALGIALFGQVAGTSQYAIGTALGMTNYTTGGSTVFSESVQGKVRIRVDRIRIRIYYSTPSARYYVGDGSGNVCSVDMVYYTEEGGNFPSGSATGSMQFTNVVPLVGNKRYVSVGNTLHATQAEAAASTNPVATVASSALYNGLPSTSRIIESSSRYQMVTANFFGREDWDGFYGVSGADKAFSFAAYDSDGDSDDDYYITRIYTNLLDKPGDTPRHVAVHQNCLALGYNYGIVRTSVPGEPENFSGEFGATDIGIGDSVTGLLSLKGTALGVFCENSIHVVMGSDPEQWQTQVISPATGAIEYTVVDFGTPTYCDTSGITTLEQSSKYGSFVGRRLSYPVTPWILRRMNRSGGVLGAGRGDGVICALPVRAKNQYRLFFKDGYVLVMNLNPDGSPSFSFSRYMLGQSGATAADLLLPDQMNKFIAPIAWSSQVDEEGKERIHISHYSTASNLDSSYNNYVYELDRGWGFAGNYIPEYYSINWWHPDPFSSTLLRKLRIDGLSRGLGSSQFYTSNDYSSAFNSKAASISIPDTPRAVLSQDYIPATSINSPAERGRGVAVKVAGKYTVGGVTSPIPPDIHQVMLLQIAAGGKSDG